MLIKKSDDIKSSEITDKQVYLSRRNFIRAFGLAGSVAATGLLYRELFVPGREPLIKSAKLANIQPNSVPGGTTNEALTPYDKVTSYNNFYEFSTFKGGVASRAENFVTRPWTVSLTGLCQKPKVFDID